MLAGAGLTNDGSRPLALHRGLQIANCGCFGVYWARPLTAVTLVEDALLLALACLM